MGLSSPLPFLTATQIVALRGSQVVDLGRMREKRETVKVIRFRRSLPFQGQPNATTLYSGT